MGLDWDLRPYQPPGALTAAGPLRGKVVTKAAKIRSFDGHSHEVSSVAYSPDGRYGLSGSSDGTLRLWDLEAGTQVRRFFGHTGQVWCVAFSPDGRQALSGSKDQTVRLWDV